MAGSFSNARLRAVERGIAAGVPALFPQDKPIRARKLGILMRLFYKLRMCYVY
jgi:hypothetical protein